MSASTETDRRRSSLRLFAVGVVLLAIALATAWLNRKALVREALTGWLRGKGVASEAEVKSFGPTRFSARLRIGPAKDPIFTAEDADVGYRLTLHGIEVSSMRLQRPTLRAAMHGGKVSLGSLDPLIRDLLSRPPRPDATRPEIVVRGGRLLLGTDYGPLTVTADATVSDGQLQRLAAVTAPAHLKGPVFEADLGQASLNVVNNEGQLNIRLDAPLKAAATNDTRMGDARLGLSLQAPYPDIAKQRLDGDVKAQVRLSAATLGVGARRLQSAAATASFAGAAHGGIADLTLNGAGDADLRAAGAATASARAGQTHLSVAASDLRWTRGGGDRASANLALTANIKDLAAGDAGAATLAVTARGPLAASRSGLVGELSAHAAGRAAWRGLGPVAPADAPTWAALKRAAGDLRFDAPDVRLRLAADGAAVALPRPLRLTPASGGRVEIAGHGAAAVFGPKGGALTLTAAGGGLPQAKAEISRLTVSGGVMRATGHVRAADLALGVVRGGRIDTAGTLTASGGRLTYAASGCAPFAAERLEFGANDARDVGGRFCPAGAVTFAGGAWRIAGRAESVAATIPFLQARVSDAAGQVTASGRGGRPVADISIETGRIQDTAPAGRFNPLLASGAARLSGDVWRADFDVRLPRGQHVAHAHLVHDSLTGGGVEIATGDLDFAEGGLQPAALSPMAATIGSPAVGRVRFDGRFDWNAQGAASSGRLEIPKLDFRSPAGRIEGLSGDLEFTSLAPLEAAAGQQLHIDRIDAIVPVTDVTARFSLAGTALRIEGGEASVGGGKVRVEQLDVPFGAAAPIEGVLLLDGVQLHDLVEASPFGDRVDLDARVSGRIPFTAEGSHVRVKGGELKAIAPGRLSIDRAAITGVKAAGALETPDSPAPAPQPVSPNDTFTDFAYQAMEHLAFDTLDASIASQDDGRLGVLFHIVGKFDPPKRQEIRLSLWDLIQKKFLGRKLPLPSGTGVNLTLDTTLNLDDLLADYGDYRRLHGSGAVQPRRIRIGEMMTETNP